MKKSEAEGMKASQQIATEHELTLRRVIEPVVFAQSPPSPERPARRPSPLRQELTVTDRASIASEGKEQARAWYKQTVPLWVTLCGGGVGIIIIVFAVKYARKSSPAIDAAWSAADSAVAGVIRNLRTKAASAADPNERATLQAHIADLEAERGRMGK